ncbi:MAG: carotenoid biosynthesis protein [Chitinophagales bacterium]|nr:carotenoid biosynthesis protein [Chitinophagales bacterium]
MKLPLQWQGAAIVAIFIVYLVGLIGFLFYPTTFTQLTPFNILYCSILALAFHRSWGWQKWVLCISIFIAGFLVEWLGVETGLIFGNYFYGDTLGYKIGNIPVLIGLNWLLLIYCTATIAGKLFQNIYVRCIVGAFLMVFIDLVLEPFAIQYGLWSWQHTEVPMRNYVAWWLISFAMLYPVFKLQLPERNRVAIAVYIAQFVFFLLLLVF